MHRGTVHGRAVVAAWPRWVVDAAVVVRCAVPRGVLVARPVEKDRVVAGARVVPCLGATMCGGGNGGSGGGTGSSLLATLQTGLLLEMLFADVLVE